ncbi:MAG: hypothetical protein RMK19_01330 [Bacteroidia bacterium]|nr:hypothetical protein [Bacteroidia bacterium]MDW8014637.1 hypothetical protein [Bacteroidia bacterium]
MKEFISIAFIGFLLLSFHALLSPILSIENIAYPAPYILFWMILPFSWSFIKGGAVAIAYGILLDLLFPPHGLQTFCGLWVWGLRKPIYRLLHPTLPPEWELTTSVRQFNSSEFFAYAFPLTLLHQLWYLSLAAWNLSFQVLLLIGLSAAYTFFWEWIIFEIGLRQRYVRA